MIVETEEVEETTWKGDQRCNLHRVDWSGANRRIAKGSAESIRWMAIRQHQNREWEARAHRSVNDVSKEARLELEIYEWALVEKGATFPCYKK